ncbi:hypothetical protein GHT06_018019 [Daphnia sinensis]|uniref:Uncharacterized protein n=1 Tax=Daphnia sinensis TaxID=1820382 RepID=A0AAD5KML6_9CRUS|nr:hypothetical protein GHT06_018019 [Daphnia sinensis]
MPPERNKQNRKKFSFFFVFVLSLAKVYVFASNNFKEEQSFDTSFCTDGQIPMND